MNHVTEQKRDEINKWRKEFSTRLRHRMEYLNLRNIDISKSTGICISLIGMYVSGKTIPRANHIRKLAVALAVDSSYLVDF